jgi:hypothetical protein
MPHLQDCPSCKATLSIADFVTAPWLTCPRCLAKIPNQKPSNKPTCMMCAEEIPPGVRTCPHCRSVIAGSLVDMDVERDTSRVSGAMIPMAMIGVAGVGWYLMNVNRGTWGVLLSAAFAAVVIVGIVLAMNRGNETAQGIGRIILRSLAILGIVFIVGAAVGLAILVFLFVTCLAAMGHH